MRAKLLRRRRYMLVMASLSGDALNKFAGSSDKQAVANRGGHAGMEDIEQGQDTSQVVARSACQEENLPVVCSRMCFHLRRQNQTFAEAPAGRRRSRKSHAGQLQPSLSADKLRV